MVHRRPTCLLAALSTLTLCAQACIIDTTSSQDLTCETEGARLGERSCQDGVWIQAPEEMLDMDTGWDEGLPPDLGVPDMLVPVDMPDTPDISRPGDMPADLSEDMPDDMSCTAPDPAIVCAQKQACNTDLTLEQDACGNQPVVSCAATCAQGTCIDTQCVPCPTTQQDYCDAIVKQRMGSQVLCGTWDQPELQGCAIPDGPQLECVCPGDEVCEIEAGTQGTCGACMPLSPDELLAGLSPGSCGTIQVDDGCGGRVDLMPQDRCELFESCTPSSLVHRGQPVSTCQPIPATELPMPNPAPSADAGFGHSITVHGDLMAIGAPFDTNGNPGGAACGSVYVYERDPSNNAWAYQDQLVVEDSSLCNNGNEQVGWSVAIVGRFIVVGAPGDGSAGRVFFFSDGNNDKSWSRVGGFDGSLNGSRDGGRFGHSVAVLYDGTPTNIGDGTTYITIGAPDDRRGGGGDDREGIVYSFLYLDNTGGGDDEIYLSVLESPGNQSNSNYGERLLYREALSNTPRLIISHPDWSTNGNEHGAIYESDARTPGTRKNLGTDPISGIGIENDDEFGAGITSDGPWLGIGAPQYQRAAGNASGIAAIYHDTDSGLHAVVEAWSAGGGDRFGESIGISYPWMLVGAPYEDGENDAHDNTGAVYLFEHDGTTWQPQHIWRAMAQPDDAFTGHSVATTTQWAFFGAPEQGNGRVYMIPLSP